jgi:hypothetical protein
VSEIGIEVIDERGPADHARPFEKRNAMTVAMFDAVTHASKTPSPTTPSESSCSAGAVIISVLARDRHRESTPAENVPPSRARASATQPGACRRLDDPTLFEAEIPIVSAVQGYAAGIGNTPRCPEIDVVAAVGTVLGAVRRAWVHARQWHDVPPPRLIGVARAKEMILRGKRIDGTDPRPSGSREPGGRRRRARRRGGGGRRGVRSPRTAVSRPSNSCTGTSPVT